MNEKAEATTQAKAEAVFVTSKLSVVAWLQIHQVDTVRVRRIADDKLEYTFRNGDGRCDMLYAEWLNSKTCMFDNRMRELKRQFRKRGNGDVRHTR